MNSKAEACLKINHICLKRKTEESYNINPVETKVIKSVNKFTRINKIM